MESKEIARAVHAYDALKMHEKRLGYRSLPAFIGIGPGRAGTTSLFSLLQRNAEVHLPSVKELNYFGFRSRQSQPSVGMTLDEYSTYFIGAPRNAICGEISPAYFILPDAIREIASALPDCRLISGLRHPFERLLSHFKYHRENHGYTDLDAFIKKAREDFPHRRDPRLTHHWFTPVRILASSLYADTLALCGELLPREHILIYLFEDYVRSQASAQAIQHFLGVEPVADPASRMNASELDGSRLTLRRGNFDWLRETLLEDLARCMTPGVPPLNAYIESLQRGNPAELGIEITPERG